MIYQRGFLARPLDAVLGHSSRLAALRVLFARPEGLSGRKVAAHAEINHQSALTALQALEKAGFVKKREVGRSVVWRLDRSRYLVEEALLALFEGEARHAQEIVSSIKNRLDRKCEAVVIVGPAARGRLEVGEPLELVILYDRTARRELPGGIRDLARELDEKFAVALKFSMMPKRDAYKKLEIVDGWQLLPTEGRPTVFIGER